MKKEEKELLLKDLCARFPYGVKCKIAHSYKDKATQDVVTLTEMSHISPECYFEKSDEYEKIENVTPYLRPMSSMTEEENKQRKELGILLWSDSNDKRGFDGFDNISGEDILKAIDWLNKYMFDYRGLIDKGLAIEVTKENNPYKQ